MVQDSFEGFQEMYKPLIAEDPAFRDLMEIKDGQFLINNECSATQRQLLMQINDNVYKNLNGFSVQLFDKEHTWRKDKYTHEDKLKIVDKLIACGDRKKQEAEIFYATDRILYAHRNLKALIFLTSGPFFIGLWFSKAFIKLALVYLIYNKTKKVSRASGMSLSSKLPATAQVNRQ